MTAILAAGAAFLLAPTGDLWNLKPGFAAKQRTAWNVAIDIEFAGPVGRAELVLERVIDASDEKGAKGSYALKDVMLEGSPVVDDISFPCAFGPRGNLVSTESEFGEDLRRMLSPFVFVYPEAPVSVGDKWVFEAKPESGTHTTVSWEVVAAEKLKEAEALKVSASLVEKREDAMRSKGFFWIDRSGKVLKFTLDVTEWPVPMAGAPVGARISGELAGGA